MNLRDLKYLVAVAQERHFGRAADACFVSQPTLSTQIKKLEEFLGVTLLERSSRQVLLTPVGERIVAQARVVLREVDELVQMAQQARDPFGGDFRLGIIPTVAPYLLPRVLPGMRKQFPQLRVQLIEAQTATVVSQLLAGELDAGILALPLGDEPLVQRKLYSENFLFAVGREHPKADRKHVTLKDLDGEEILLLEDGHCLRDQALDVCSRAGAVENTNFRATSIETLRQMVAANIGVTLMPEMAVSARPGPVRYIPFRGDRPHRDVGLAWRPSCSRVPLLERLGQVLEELVA